MVKSIIFMLFWFLISISLLIILLWFIGNYFTAEILWSVVIFGVAFLIFLASSISCFVWVDSLLELILPKKKK